ncbi:MAG TPA: c-type cytochrome [Parasegetibacter sp.]
MIIRPNAKKIIFSFLLFSTLILGGQVMAQDGKALFNSNCASCHHPLKDVTGPALKGSMDRWGSKEKLHAWVRNSQAVIKSGDQYAVDLFNKWNKVIMTSFPTLSDEEIDAIFAYVEGFKAPAAKDDSAGGTGGAAATDNSLLFGIITLILAVVALILLQVNSNLRKLADDKENIPAPEPVPFYRNKAYIALVIIVLFIVGGYFVINGAIGLGRSQNYQPEQPIFFSHKVHAGINQINCLYCHNSAEKSKHATIPSINVCMNCHMDIKEYTGEKLYTADGKEVNGTAEIQKLYEFAGYTPGEKWDPSKAKPIEWIKIHNLPDHVYFNHAQHVSAGKVQCQTCHGAIQEMDEVKQFSDLSMGWCVNCHRETEVQFKDNKFYSIYEKFHEDLKNKKINGVTVEKIGGTECQKCHY